jgi:hypothetical protein
LETFVLTLHVPRTISDADVSAMLKHLRGKKLWRRLQNMIAEFLRASPATAPITVSITLTP